MREYYDARAPEYDEWYEGAGLFSTPVRPGWDDELRALRRVLESLPPVRTLDVACGTGYLTRYLRGALVALDQSPRMVAIAAERLPHAECVVGDALELPFSDSAFDRVFTGHFYGHLEPADRTRFLAEARRVAGELVVVDASLAHAQAPEYWQERVLNDGSRWQVFKRHFTGSALADELGGGEVLHEGHWFVVVRA